MPCRVSKRKRERERERENEREGHRERERERESSPGSKVCFCSGSNAVETDRDLESDRALAHSIPADDAEAKSTNNTYSLFAIGKTVSVSGDLKALENRDSQSSIQKCVNPE
jgi:hypothetical protein